MRKSPILLVMCFVVAAALPDTPSTLYVATNVNDV